MTDTLAFDIAFLGPFHVARGQAAAGLDRSVDRDIALPATSLKGLLRAEARDVLRVRPSLVDEVFGGRSAAPWAFSDAELEKPEIRRAARIKITGNAGQAEDDMLMLGESVWSRRGRFLVERTGRLDQDHRELHTLVITAAAFSVTALGGGRRRGNGWVSISRDGFTWDSAHTERLIAQTKMAS